MGRNVLLRTRNNIARRSLPIKNSSRQGWRKSSIRSGFLLAAILLCPFMLYPYNVPVALAQNTPPVANAGGDRDVYTNDSITLMGSATDPDGDPIVAWQWSLDSKPTGSLADLAPIDSPNPIFFADTEGAYIVSLIVFDGTDWSLPDTITIRAADNLPPVAVIAADPISGPAPLTVQFDGSGSYDPEGGELRYSWQFDDGNGSTDVSATNIYIFPGDYTVRFTVVDELGEGNQATILITVLSEANTPPIADAGGDRDVYTNDSITLMGSGIDPDGDPIVAWQWSVDSQPPGSSVNLFPPNATTPSFSADTEGEYLVSLIVFDGTDWSLPDTITIRVADNLPPVAVIAADPISGPAPLTVQFDGSGSFDPEGGNISFLWRFGTGDAAIVPTPSSMYLFPGEYTVDLLVTDELGATGQDTVLITVLSEANTPPTISPVATPISGSAPLLVEFAANAMDDDGDPLTHAWDFGDPGSADNTSTDANPSHVYTTPGSYLAWVTVSDSQDEVSGSITIVVDQDLGFSVKAAWVKWSRRDRTRGQVSVRADITPMTPEPDDVVTIYVDGIMLFAAPFSSFVPICNENDDDGNNNSAVSIFTLKDRFLCVIWNVTTGHVWVYRRNIDLHTLDNTNGVDVEFHLGSSVAVENIMMTPLGQRRLYYWRGRNH
ncbi:Cytochrome c551/c552 [Olavius algarvensis associated proteobacterium Delta 3]|nr:Cytochrome c551/c552 [Olavius algarvensis associated proteobacterium Delta 3]